MAGGSLREVDPERLIHEDPRGASGGLAGETVAPGMLLTVGGVVGNRSGGARSGPLPSAERSPAIVEIPKSGGDVNRDVSDRRVRLHHPFPNEGRTIRQLACLTLHESMVASSRTPMTTGQGIALSIYNTSSDRKSVV